MKTKLPFIIATAILTLGLHPSPLLAQGSLTPPGAPAPTMKSLDQVEPRTPISIAPFTITKQGSYYLTTNLTVNAGNAITIAASQVTLNLNGFTISSTAPSATGAGILLSIADTDIAILNGHINGSVTNNNGVFGGGGFVNGIIYTNGAASNVHVSDISVSGCLSNGIYLGYPNSTVVESCTVKTVGYYGIYADSITRCTVKECGNTGVDGSTVSDSRADTIGNGYGFNVIMAHNCLGLNNGNGVGLSVSTASDCWGLNNGNGYGLLATTANDCQGTSSGGTGLAANTANNCNGQSSGAGAGISVVTANNCTGNSVSGAGLLISGVATGSYGSSSSGSGITAKIAEACVVGGGTTNITYKYNMP